MIRRVLSIIFYVIAGHVFGSAGIVAFISIPADGMIKLFLLGLFLFFAVLSLVIGLLISPSRKKKREAGIVLFASSVEITIVILGILFVILEPNKPEGLDMEPLYMFKDYVSGIGTLLIFIISGVLLFVPTKPNPAPENETESDQ